jgi:Zn-dependent protease with chaperone function
MTALPFLIHGTTLALAWFLIVNAVTTLIVAILSGAVGQRAASARPGVWLALRLAPAVLSVLFVAGLFLPSYWRYEPREFVEGFDMTFTALALLAFATAAAGATRGVRAWRRAAERTATWMRHARPLALPGSAIPAFAIEADVPMMALVGLFRPRLLITRPVLDVLTAEELRAAVAHERGHWRALDNLKRLAMRATPDLLWATPAARSLERRWVAASEYVADRAAGDSGVVRCALASALVKVARLTPPISTFGEPISALVDEADITGRVQRLLDDAHAAAPRGRAQWFVFPAAVAGMLVAYAPLLRVVHGVTEILVNTLP